MEIRDLTKIYISEKGLKCCALNGINLKLPSKGLVFVLGKSGCGKSTLLNMIGALDIPTHGNIFYDEIDITKLSDEDRGKYISENIGFIFQDFNLLDELNVKENILLGQPKDFDELRFTAIINDLDIADCVLKNVNELSGGQQQRVAIARALTKESRILLADEPTGNLDKVNSEKIFSMLKEISMNRLVVVVSHDIISAEKYADVLVQISDGKIVEVKEMKVGIEIRNPEKGISTPKNNTLPISTKIKLSRKFILQKKFRLLISTIMLAVSLSIMGLMIVFQQFDFGYTSAKLLLDKNETCLRIMHGYTDSETKKYVMTEALRSIDFDAVSELSSKFNIQNVDYTYALYGVNFSSVNSGNTFLRNHISHAVISKHNHLEQYGIKVKYGNFPEKDSEVAITDYLAYSINLQRPDIVLHRLGVTEKEALYDDENFISLLENLDSYTLESLFSSEWPMKIRERDTLELLRNNLWLLLLNCDIDFGVCRYKLSCILETQSIMELNSLMESVIGDTLSPDEKQILSLDSISLYNSFFVNEKWIANAYNKNYLQIGSLQIANQAYASQFVTLSPLSSGEVYLSRSAFRNYFKTDFVLGEKYIFNDKLQTGNSQYMDVIYEGMDLIVKDVFDNTPEFKASVIYENAHYDNYKQNIMYVDGITFKLPSDVVKVKAIIDFMSKNEMSYVTPYSYYMYNLGDIMDIFKVVFLLLGIILLVFSIVLLGNYFTATINSHKRDVGIMRSLGIRNKNISSIFLYGSLLIATLTIVISITLMSVLVFVCDGLLVQNYATYANTNILRELQILSYGAIPYLAIIAIGFVVSLISIFLPMYKLKSMSPINVIRGMK